MSYTGGGSDISPTNVLSSEGNPQTISLEDRKKSDSKYEERDFLANTAKMALSHSADARRRYDYEWMVRDLFRRGYQFSRI